MRKLYFFLLTAFLAVFSLNAHASSFVTYEFSGGRLGDNLITYLHGKWISYAYDIPLLYKPFPMSELFAFHYEEDSLFTPTKYRSYKKVLLGRDQGVETPSSLRVLYVVPYFPESPCERVYFRDGHGDLFPYFKVNWKDPEFRKLALSLLQPISPPLLCPCPKDKVTVAIHVRTGGGFDDKNIGLKQPIKFPPEEFYLEQLSTLCEMLEGEEIHCHIFTDDTNPEKIAEKFQSHLKNKQVTFSYRKHGNHHSENILDDLFSMLQFDCLIRPESSFSILPSLLKDYAILIYPADFCFVNNKPKITKVSIEINGKPHD